jgi:hypothetical protein
MERSHSFSGTQLDTFDSIRRRCLNWKIDKDRKVEPHLSVCTVLLGQGLDSRRKFIDRLVEFDWIGSPPYIHRGARLLLRELRFH